MHKLGLKLWSSNLFYIKPARDLFNARVFDYVELYVVPGTEEGCLPRWRHSPFQFILHAPHSYHGFNLSLKEREVNNRKYIKEVDSFRRTLDPKYVIFHSGTGGSVKEMIRQVSNFKNEFPELFAKALVENKPKIGVNGEACVGATPEELKEILAQTKIGFCLDLGHAICYAAWRRIMHDEVIEQFLELNPKMFHLSDGDLNSPIDQHLNFGSGNYDIEAIISKIILDTYLSIETNKKPEAALEDFKHDVDYLKKILRKQ